MLAVAALAATALPGSGPVAPAAAGAAGPGPALAGVPESFFGVSGRRLNHRDLDGMERAGVGTYRALFHLRLARGSKGRFYPWSAFDRLVGQMASRGIDLLPLLYGTARWISRDEATPPIHDAEARATWVRLLGKLVSRYGPNGLYWRLNPLVPYRPIRAWQIWNEPNDDTYWAPTPNPGEYAELLQLSAAAIHRIDPAATIVAAGIVAEPFSGGIPGPDYLAALAANPAARKAADKFAYHPYGKNVIAVRRHLRRARRALIAGGAPKAPLWVTEVGWGSKGVLERLLTKDEGGQARALRLTFRMIARRRGRLGVERALWYYWRDHYDPTCIWCRTAGLVTHGNEPKPSLEAFRTLRAR